MAVWVVVRGKPEGTVKRIYLVQRGRGMSVEGDPNSCSIETIISADAKRAGKLTEMGVVYAQSMYSNPIITSTKPFLPSFNNHS